MHYNNTHIFLDIYDRTLTYTYTHIIHVGIYLYIHVHTYNHIKIIILNIIILDDGRVVQQAHRSVCVCVCTYPLGVPAERGPSAHKCVSII